MNFGRFASFCQLWLADAYNPRMHLRSQRFGDVRKSSVQGGNFRKGIFGSDFKFPYIYLFHMLSIIFYFNSIQFTFTDCRCFLVGSILIVTTTLRLSVTDRPCWEYINCKYLDRINFLCVNCCKDTCLSFRGFLGSCFSLPAKVIVNLTATQTTVYV